MTLSIPRVLALGPTGQEHPGLVVAAGRAGGLGFLDFGFGIEADRAIAAMTGVGRYWTGRYGLRIAAGSLAGLDLGCLPTGLAALIVVEPLEGDWRTALDAIRAPGRLALAEVTSRDSARSAAQAGADGLILAGHEAGGAIGEESSFVLLQGVLADGGPPVWVRGGIGPSVASACVAVGASGVVLDGALLLARESPLAGPIRDRVKTWDGGETIVLGRSAGRPIRVHVAPGSAGLSRLRAAEAEGPARWAEAIRAEIGWKPGSAWPAGQDTALAAGLAHRHGTVGGIVQAVERAIVEGPRAARLARPMAEGSPLARSHGTSYPIAQGPMTRVSDTTAFASAVAEGGGLPFLALALMRGPEVRTLLAEASGRLAGRPWGVGILGFVPPELRREQAEAIREAMPPFALIAGGRPDQALELERAGIATYLHVPSPGLLKRFLRDGARRFVLEGRECGGHVGPRSSFVLWEQALEAVRGAIDAGTPAGEVHLLFAGGVHDARSAAFVATLAGPLAARGVKVGALIGTGYLFTAEAVSTGAILADFQAEAVRCTRTVLLETGPGHEVRASPTPFANAFDRERRRLLGAGRPADEVRAMLEDLNVGRLRVATKGLEREARGSSLAGVDAEARRDRGLYMIGQVATLRDRVTTIDALHREVAEGATAWLDRLEEPAGEISDREDATPSDVAIIGMAAIMPGAGDVGTFWRNTLGGVDAITEIPADRWDWRLYYDADPKAPDKITSKWGGFVPDVSFDPLRYGMPPSSLPSIEPMQMLTLEAVRAALDDAGYRDRPFPRARTAVVLGAGGGAAQLSMGYAFRSYLPLLDTVKPGAGREALEAAEGRLPEWTEDSFPGILLNVAAGRVANRFDLGGANYTVDAACGSSLAAAALAVRELESGAADMVVLGGADTVQNPFTYLAFSKTHAFSPRGRCRPFDAKADGIVISEGVAALILKRLADAERDGDRIYAVIKGLGASSDGRAKGLTAPNDEGQVRALERAYAKAGVSPATVGYVEAHGTGTAAGDLAEIGALNRVFRGAGAGRGACALGSVKSSIGHTKCAAGLAGLINASLALHHKVLPPTIGVEVPNSKAGFDDGPFHISASTRPWLHDDAAGPRRAGVSAFGFGGTNFHAVLEAYEGDPADRPSPRADWPADLFAWRAADRPGLLEQVDRLRGALAEGARPALRDLARNLLDALPDATSDGPALAIVAGSIDDFRAKLDRARAAIEAGSARLDVPSGIQYAERPTSRGAPVAFLFPGQGSQYPGMLTDLAVTFPEVREGIESFDAALRAQGLEAVGPRIFPPPAFDDDHREAQRAALRSTEVTQPAVGAACLGMLRLLGSFGIEADQLAGHSYGELVALHAAGSLTLEALAELSEARGRLILEAAGPEPGTMAALSAGPAQVAAVLDGLDDVIAANWNGPSQTVVAGTKSGVAQAIELARALGLRAQPLPVACAFHSPLVAGARSPLSALVARLGPAPPDRPVFGNATADPYPSDPAAIAGRLGEHLARPVRFAEMIEAMYAQGARVFIEAGPGGVASALVGSILADRPHLAVATDQAGRPCHSTFLTALGRLFVAGVHVRLDRLAFGRGSRALDPVRFTVEVEPPSPSTWLVNGARARPIQGPEPIPFGQGPALPIPEVKAAVAEPEPPRPRRPTPMPSDALRPPERNGTSRLNQVRPPTVPSIADRPAGADRVIEAFQETMRKFLDVQQSTMLAYLGARNRLPEAPPASPLRNGHPEPVPNGQVAHLNGNGNAPAPPMDLPEPELTAETRPLPPVAPGPVSNPAPTQLDREAVAGRLLGIVQERTGYPLEMLRLNLDLEGDLGIDSIKRVEILGSLRDALPDRVFGRESETMDQLSRARTMGAIVDRIAKGLEAEAVPEIEPTSTRAAPEPPAPTPKVSGDAERGSNRDPEGASTVRRMILESVDAPLGSSQAGLAPGGIVLVTDDGRGVARALAADLRALGHRVVRVRHGLAGLEENGDAEAVNLASSASVGALLDRVRARGPLAGIVHALPMADRPPAGLDPDAWSARMGTEVRGLFLLARGAAEDLARSASRGGACLIAATALGGSFASAGEPPADFFPGQGGIAGLVKTLAREWPGVRARVVDFDPTDDLEVIAADLVREVLAADARPEVGYQGGRRLAIRPRVAVLPAIGPGAGRIELSPGDPVILTGGARGITATVAADLAARWRPTLLLVGSSPAPLDAEDPRTAGRTSAADLKAILLERLRREAGREEVGPAEVERAYQSLRRGREIRANVQALRDAGSVVEYVQADVRDAEALGNVLAGWHDRFGPPVGLIHGAGVIQDKLLTDKSPESFDRVLRTKLDGALALARHIRADRLRFAAFFSSVAGRFGNRGQGDYAAANEALNKLAIWLDRRWAGRVVSLIWGPWSGVGMVSDLESHLGRQGLGMIPPEVGRSRLADELRLGRKGDVEVIVAGDLGAMAEPATPPGPGPSPGAIGRSKKIPQFEISNLK